MTLLPDGQGTYTWSNGDNYVGEFEKGLKSGSGKLTYADCIIIGYWVDDEYIGKYEYPYKMFSAGKRVTDIHFTRIGDDIVFCFESRGRQKGLKFMPVKAYQGNYASLLCEPKTNTLTQVNYPIRLMINVGDIDIIINQPGNWHVKVIMSRIY